MLKKARIEKAVEKRCDAIDAHMEDYCTTRDPEALHRLRVEVKKLQAMMVLIEACGGEGALHIKGFKKIYKQAGRIREAHVNLDLLAKHHIDSPAIVQEQERTIKEESAVFCASRHAYRHDVHHGKHALYDRAFDIRKHQVVEFFKSRLLQLSAFFAPSFLNTGGLHETRKDVKNLLYIHALLPEGLAGDLHVHTAYLDALQDKIGQWHDAVAVSTFLAGFKGGAATELEQVEIHGRVLLDEIRAMTTDFKLKVEENVAL